MKFVVYYESFYIYDEIVIDYNTLWYHKKESNMMGTLKKFYTNMKNYFPYSEANISAAGQEIPPRFLTPRGTSRAHNDLSTLNTAFWTP
jgi:hypothetical protein